MSVVVTISEPISMPSFRTVFMSLPRASHLAVPPTVLILVMATAQVMHGFIDLAHIRNDIAGGALWRLLSGQFVHHTIAHLALNATGLTVVWLIGHREYPGFRFVLLSFTVAVVTGCLLYLYEPQLNYYLGFSGTLHGLLAAIAVRMTVHRLTAGYVLGTVLLIKLAWEYSVVDANAGTAAIIGLRVATEAHVWGTVSGLLTVSPLVAYSVYQRATKSPQSTSHK